MKTTFRIGIAADHAGFELKETIKDFLSLKGYTVTDFGTHSEDSVDYPDFAHALGSAMDEEKFPFGIAICGSGEGIIMLTGKCRYDCVPN